MFEFPCVVATVAIFLFALVARPERARCPVDRWVVHGVRPDGRYYCMRPPPPETACARAGTCADVVPDYWPGRIDGRIYCTGGSRPIVIDWQTVGCQR